MKVAAFIVIAALALAAATSTTLAPFDDKEILWTKCINISESNTACVSLFAVPENVTFGFEFALDNIVVDFPLIAGNETYARPLQAAPQLPPPNFRVAVASMKPICSR